MRTQAGSLDFQGVATAANLKDPSDRRDATPKSYVDQLADELEELRQRFQELIDDMGDANTIIRVGPQRASDGASLQARGARDGSIVQREMGARFEEAIGRNLIYTASIGAAGVAPGTALSTTPPLVLYNPPNSGRILTVLESTLGYVSGTLGAGQVVYAAPSAPQPAAPTGGTVLAAISALLGGVDGLAVGIPLSGSTLAAVPRLLKAAYTLGAALATTPAFAALVKDYVNGMISILPGNFLALQGITAAGSVPLVSLSLTWQETEI